MNFIDAQGRLFGKVNIIDFAVVVFLLSFIPVFYYGYKAHQRKSAAVTTVSVAEKQEAGEDREYLPNFYNVDCLFLKVPKETAQKVKAGDKEMDKDNQMIGEIIEVAGITPYLYEFYTESNQKEYMQDNNLKQIGARLSLKAQIKDKKIFYKDFEIVNKSRIDFIGPDYNLSGVFIIEKQQAPLVAAKKEPVSNRETELLLKEKSEADNKRFMSFENQVSELQSQITKVSRLEERLSRIENQIIELRESIDKKKKKKR